MSATAQVLQATSKEHMYNPCKTYGRNILAPAPRKVVPSTFSGSIDLVGPIELCYNVTLNPPRATISLKVVSMKVACGELSLEQPYLRASGNYGPARWDINVCFGQSKGQLTLQGKASFAEDFFIDIDIAGN